MKKRLFGLTLCLLLLVCSSAAAEGGMSFYRRMTYGALAPYENMAYGYALSVYERFVMVSDEEMETVWQNLDASLTEEDDEVYDLHIWYDPEGRYQFEVQLKEPTYDSFDTEVEMAPQYLDLVRDQYDEDSNVRMLHEGILRDTPAGQMLETALAYDDVNMYGDSYTVIFLYYDFYAGDREFCLTLHAYDGDYEAAQSLLDEIAHTFQVSDGSVQA